MKKRHRWEDGLAVFVLLAMASLPLLEIVIRRFYTPGIPGSAIWVQHLVLWTGFLGAALASRRGELLALTAGVSLLSGRARTLAQILTTGVSFAICMTLAYGALELVRVEREGGRLLALDLPVWVVQLIMPAGFTLIAFRMLLRLEARWPGRLAAASAALVPLALGGWDGLREAGLLLPLLAVVLAATALGAPIFVALGGAAALLLWNNADPVSAIPLEVYNLSVNPLLPTLPLFTLAGYLLAEGGTPRRLVALFRTLFGWMPGGVAVVAVLVCAFFTSFTGGSGVTILAMGGLLYPMLVAEHHPHRFNTGLLTAAGSLGLLFPPSLAVILYGLVAEIEIRTLFWSGLLPGILEIGLVAGYVLLYGKHQRIPRVPFDGKEALRALWKARWEVAIPVVVLGSILGGFATLVEASAVTVLYAFILEVFIHRELPPGRELVQVIRNAATLIGGVLLILGVALGLTNYLVIAEVPAWVVQLAQSYVESPLLFLLLLNLFLLAVGCLMDIYSAIMVVVPLIAPLGAAYGINPFHLGVIFLINLELGYLTPPVGMNLFLASYRFQRPLPEVYRASLPFLGIRALAVLLVTYLPFLTGLV